MRTSTDTERGAVNLGMVDALQVVLTPGEGETFALGCHLGRHALPGDVFLLTGPLGAGKTVLARGIAAGLEVPTWRGSPTFTLVNEYEGRAPLAHLDLYRIAPDEIEDLDLDVVVARDRVTVVEWGEKLEPELAAGTRAGRVIHVALDYLADDTRRIEIRSC